MGIRSGETVTVDDRGRITLPKEVRERLHLDEGANLDLDLEDGEIRLRPDRTRFEPISSGTTEWDDDPFLDASEAMVGDLEDEDE